MEEISQKLISMEERISNLENSNDKLFYDILTLRKENGDLQKENVDFKREIRCLKQGSPLKSVPVRALAESPESDNTRKLMDIQGEVKRLKDIVGKVESSHTDVLNEVKSLKASVGKVESSHKTIRKEVKRLKEKVAETDSSQMNAKEEHDLLERLKMSLNGVLVKAHTFGRKMPVLERRLDDLEKENSLHKQLAAHRLRVRLIHTSELSTGVECKLNKCDLLYVGSMCDVQTGCIVPPVAGCYAVSTQMMQDGEGEIVLRLRRDGDVPPGPCCGLTDRHNGNVSSVHLLQLNQGQKVWFEAKRRNGDCKVNWCRVNVWLLH